MTINVFLDNPINIIMSLVMSNKMSMSMITSTCFYCTVLMFSATSTKVCLLRLTALDLFVFVGHCMLVVKHRQKCGFLIVKFSHHDLEV